MFFLLLGVLCLVIGMMRSANERCVEKQQIPTDDFTGSLTDLTDTSIYLVFFNLLLHILASSSSLSVSPDTVDTAHLQ